MKAATVDRYSGTVSLMLAHFNTHSYTVRERLNITANRKCNNTIKQAGHGLSRSAGLFTPTFRGVLRGF